MAAEEAKNESPKKESSEKKVKKVVVLAKRPEEETETIEVSVQPHMEQYSEWELDEIVEHFHQGLDFLEKAHQRKSYKDFKQCILDLKDLAKICQANLSAYIEEEGE